MKNTTTESNNTWVLATKQWNHSKSVSNLLGAIGISLMTIATPAQADGTVDGRSTTISSQTPDITRLSSPLSSSEDATNSIWGHLTSLYETVDKTWVVGKLDVLSLYNNYVLRQQHILPKVSEYMRGHILELLYSLLENGYTLHWHKDLEKLTFIIESLEWEGYNVLHHTNVASTPLFSEDIYITADKKWKTVTIQRHKSLDDLPDLDTASLSDIDHKYQADAAIASLLYADLSLPQQDALNKYKEYAAKVRQLQSSISSKNRTISSKESEIEQLGRELTDLESELVSIKKQAQSDIEKAKHDKDEHYTTKIANNTAAYTAELASKDWLLSEKQDEITKLENSIEWHKKNISGFYAAIPSDVSLDRSGNLETDTSQLLDTIFTNFEKQLGDIKKEYIGIITNKDTEIEVLDREVASLRSELKKLDTTLTENQKLEQANQQLSSSNSELREQVQLLDKARTSGVGQLNESISENIEISRKNTELTDVNTRLLKELENSKDEIIQLQSAKKSWEEQLNESISDNIEISRKNTELTDVNTELLKQLEEFKKKVTQLEGENSDLTAKLSSVKEALDFAVAAKID